MLRSKSSTKGHQFVHLLELYGTCYCEYSLTHWGSKGCRDLTLPIIKEHSHVQQSLCHKKSWAKIAHLFFCIKTMQKACTMLAQQTGHLSKFDEGDQRPMKLQHKAYVIELKMASKLPFIEDEQDKVLCGTCFCPSQNLKDACSRFLEKWWKITALLLY